MDGPDLINKSIHLFQSGSKDKAKKILIDLISVNKKNIIARYNLALMQSETGEIKTAINNYDYILKIEKNNWKSILNLYVIKLRLKKYEEALSLINNLLKIKNNYQPALRDKAYVYLMQKKPEEGLKIILKSIEQKTDDYLALNILGMIYMELGNYDLSNQALKTALNINNKYVSSKNNLGRCLLLQHNKIEAKKFFKEALAIDPNYTDSLTNLGNMYLNEGKYSDGLNYHLKANEVDKNNNIILFNIGCTYAYLEDFENAEKFYKKSLKINPQFELCKRNLSILYLRLRNYKNAWQYFDGRIGLDEFRHKNNIIHNIKNKLWNGKDSLKNKNILVVKEQGVGDEILYSSMYADAIKKFPNIVFECEPRLLSLFKRSFNYENFFPYLKFSKNKNLLDRFDKIIFAGSLGKILRKRFEDFDPKPFLKINSNQTTKVNEWLKSINKDNLIGLSWKSKNLDVGNVKSLDLENLEPLIRRKNFAFINLQYGKTDDEIIQFEQKYHLKIQTINKLDLFNDFESIAILLKKLKLFISVSNSTAHLAGALGVETWLIKPAQHAVFHYWNQPDNKSPWYSSIKLYSFNKSWDNTIKNICLDFDKKFKID